MKLERVKNTKRNIFFGTIMKVVTLLVPFIVRTIFIRKLGAEYLGLNSLFTSILQVLNLSELGFSSAVVYSMYKPVAEQDDETICALLAFYRKAYLIIGSVVLGVGICLLPFLPYLIEGDYPAGVNIHIVYLIYLVNTSLSYFLFAYKSSLLNAYQRTDVISIVKTITMLGQYIVEIIVLFTITNYYVYILAMPVFTLANNIVTAVCVNKMFPQYKCRGKLSPEIMDSIKKKVSGLMVNKLCATTRNSFDCIFVSAFLGLTATAIYNNYYYIFNSIVQMMLIFSNSMLAGTGNSIVTETREKNYEDLKKINFLYMWIAGWCTVCLLCLYQPFMKLWAGEDLMLPLSSVVLFCMYFYVLKMGDIRALYSDAAGLWWENRYRAIAESIANIILNLLFVKLFGINGIIAATLISLFIINFGLGSQLVFKYYFKNGKIMEYFGHHGIYAFVSFIACIVTYFICSLIPAQGILGLFLKAVVCCIIPNIIYFLCYFRTKQYGISIRWLLKSFHMEKKLGFLLPRSK